MNFSRGESNTILLSNGKVLVTGGNLYSAELYNPSTEIWNITSSSNNDWGSNTATLLNNGMVLLTGGSCGNCVELYNPSTETWYVQKNMKEIRSLHTATLLSNGKLLVAGGAERIRSHQCRNWHLRSSQHIDRDIVPTLGMAYQHQHSLCSSPALHPMLTLDAGALSSDKVTWGDWIDVDPGVITSTIWTVGSDGMNVPVYLRLRDIYDQTATVVTGTVDVDTTDPIAAVSPLSSTQTSTTFPVSWSGIDTTSGIKDFDIQYKDGDSAWTDWTLGTTALAADFTGQENPHLLFSCWRLEITQVIWVIILSPIFKQPLTYTPLIFSCR